MNEDWKPGPNPFGNQRAQTNETWYCQRAGVTYEVRYDFELQGFVVNREEKQAPALGLAGGNHQGNTIAARFSAPPSNWHRISPAFDIPEAAHVWFKLEGY